MATSFGDFIQSHQFTFLIGQESKPIVVHAAAVAATSPQLNALITGGLRESETQCATIEDVEVEDFIRFCEYAYRGDYTVPSWEEIPPEPSSTSDQNEQKEEIPPEPSSTSDQNEQKKENDDFDAILPSRKKKAKKGKSASSSSIIDPEYYGESIYEGRLVSRTALQTKFNNRNYLPDSSPNDLILQHFKAKSNSAVNQNFTPVLLAYARLYCFAHLRLIAPLKALTLDKLHKTLRDFKLYAKRIGDIIELARYVYANPNLPDRNNDGTLDNLKKLVVEYVVCNIDMIGKHDEFVAYLEEGGEFVGDFWRTARDYMA
ncbi:hypothetical protein B0J11DRAFT_204713 [Dendryphion nanum]|uniref:BTB domain-containing protein n=1 Tax=Dendryphion nanum TaxID=256645 RepID=A0A9P9I7C7_9PLEO|nr:hypothetical protein B0J11DRAFT_204713 [Dendryphion nanum]